MFKSSPRPWQEGSGPEIRPEWPRAGLDQNPAYYELLQEAAFKPAAEGNVTGE